MKKWTLALLFLQATVSLAQTVAVSEVENSGLRKEILAMAEEDQSARKELLKALASEGVSSAAEPDLDHPAIKAAFEKLRKIDEKNRRRISEIVRQHGWPGISIVGRDGAGMAWLLVQHADQDVQFQKQCLEMMQAAPEGEVAPQHIAMLTDRVLVNLGKRQLYGTQMDSAFRPRPIEDVQRVDQRRAAMGLPPLAEYIEQAKAVHEQMSQH